MRRPEPDSAAARRRSRAAAEWLVRRDRGLTGAEQDEFLQWLALDPRHGEWLALHRRTVADFTALADWRPEHSGEPNPDLLAFPRRRVLRSPWVVVAAAAVVASCVAVWPRPTSPAAGAGDEPRRRLLEDGSVVELNRGAMVTAVFSTSERRAVLERGEAFFAVEKDPRRPFVVRAGGVDVPAVGTTFSVRLAPAGVEVLVAEGRVAVVPPPAPAGPVQDVALVDAGHRATVGVVPGAVPEILPVAPGEIARALDWQPRMLDFASAPLGLVVAEFNRRNAVQFTLADPGLAALPVVAAIRSDNTEGLARFLAAAPGLVVERRGPAEIVVRRRE
ncbi:MAG: FecR family protein [Verrucomicrobiota bacterium]